MSYTPAQLDAATAALVGNVRGLRPDVARAWATAEQGVRYNILGVTFTDASGRQQLFSYGSWAEGALAAAHLIASGPYGGIRAALAGQSSRAQAAAIVASPWNHPYYSAGAGAAALRVLAAAPAPAPSPHGRWLLEFRSATPVYDAPGGVQVGTAWSMSAWAAAAQSGGRAWWRIASASHFAGSWVSFGVNGSFTARYMP